MRDAGAFAGLQSPLSGLRSSLTVSSVGGASPPPPAPSPASFAVTDNGDASIAFIPPGPEPDYVSLLQADYEIDGGAVQTVSRRDLGRAGFSLVEQVFLAPASVGSRSIRVRWRADGAPGAWSDAETVTVTNSDGVVTASELRERHTAFGEAEREFGFTFNGATDLFQGVDGEWFAIAPSGVVVDGTFPQRAYLGPDLATNNDFGAGGATVADWIPAAGTTRTLTGGDMVIEATGEGSVVRTLTGLTGDETYLFSVNVGFASCSTFLEVSQDGGSNWEQVVVNSWGDFDEGGYFTTGTGVTSVQFRVRGFRTDGQALELKVEQVHIRNARANSIPIGGRFNLQNGTMIDGDSQRTYLDGRATDFNDGSRTYDFGTPALPGSVLVFGTSRPLGTPNNRLENLLTLTVVSARPAKGTITPGPHRLGGRWRETLFHEMQVDLARVPTITLGPTDLPGDAWFEEMARRPAPPWGSGTAGLRELGPKRQRYVYHQGWRQTWGHMCVFASAGNFSMEFRRKVAISAVKTAIDAMSAYASQDALGTGDAYNYQAPLVWCGTVLRDGEMRGGNRYGFCGRDYSFEGDQWRYITYDTMPNSAGATYHNAQDAYGRKRRNRNRVGVDTARDDALLGGTTGIEVWENCENGWTLDASNSNGTVPYTPASSLSDARRRWEGLGCTVTDNGTQVTSITFPAARYLHGRQVTWFQSNGDNTEVPGDRSPGADYMATNPYGGNPYRVGNGAWHNHPASSYAPQHEPQSTWGALLMQMCRGEEYWTQRPEAENALYAAAIRQHAIEWMYLNDEMKRIIIDEGFNKAWGFFDLDTASGDAGARGYYSNAPFAGFFHGIMDTAAPVELAQVPDQMTSRMVSIESDSNGATFTIRGLPYDGGRAITSVEYRIDGGAPVAMPSFRKDVSTSLPVSLADRTVEFRASNAEGAGAWSKVRTIPAVDLSAFFTGGDLLLGGAMFTDTAGTTPATDGQTVRRLEGTLGNVVFIADAGRAPAKAGNLLDFRGGEGMYSNAAYNPAGNVFTMFIHCETAAKSQALLLWLGNLSGTAASAQAWLSATNDSLAMNMRSGGSGTNIRQERLENLGAFTPATYRIRFKGDVANGQITIWQDGSATPLTTVDVTTQTFSPFTFGAHVLWMGARNPQDVSVDLDYDGLMIPVGFASRDYTDGEWATIHSAISAAV